MVGVVITNNFDTSFSESEVRLFDTEEQAKKFLKRDWEDFYVEELTESMIEPIKEQSFSEDGFAKVEYENGDQVWWEITHNIIDYREGGLHENLVL